MKLLIILGMFFCTTAAAQEVDISIIDDKLIIQLGEVEHIYPLDKKDLKNPDQLIDDIIKDLEKKGE